jgi:hypothetical protein
LIALGVLLLLGGLAHSVGVSHLYVTHGVPSLDRVLLDVWIAEAQLGAGGLLLIAARRPEPHPWVVGASLIVWSWALPFLPVLIQRARPIFWVMPTLYSVACLAALVRSRR